MLLYKFGFKNFWKKPLHAILSILLIVVSLSYTGVYMLIHEYNAMELTKLCYFSTEMEKDYGFFMKNNYMLFNYSNRAVAEKLKEELHSLGQGYSVDYLYEYNDRHGHAGVSPEIDYRIEQVFGLYDIENYIAKEDKKNTLYNSKGEIAPYFKYVSDVEGGGWSSNFQNLFKNISVCYDMDEKSLEIYGYTLYGKFPEDIYDITIPWYLYKSFESYGYKNGADGERIEINSPEDIIGKELSLSGHAATVVGVLNTNQNLSDYLTFDEVTDEDIVIGLGLQFQNFGHSPVVSVFVSEEYFNSQISDEDYSDTMISVWKQSSKELREAYWELGTKWMKGLTKTEIYEDTGAPHVSLDLGAALHALEYNSVTGFMAGEVPFCYFLYCSIPFGIVLSAFLLSLGVSQSKRQFYALRTLGTKKKSLLFAYLLPAAAAMLIAVSISFVSTAILSFNLLKFGYRTILAQYHVDFSPVQLMDGRVALTFVLSGLVALAICAVSLWIKIHAMKFDRVGKKKEAKK